MLLSKEIEGKNVVIEMAEFANSVSKKYKGIVEKIVYYGENTIWIKLDSGNLINVNYARVIEIID